MPHVWKGEHAIRWNEIYALWGLAGRLVLLTQHQITFPISKPATLIHDSRALFNTSLVGYLAPAILSTSPFAILFTATKMRPQSTSCFFVSVDILVDTFVADEYLSFLQSARDLLRAPVCFEFCLHKGLDFSADPWLWFAFSTSQSLLMGLFWAIASLPLVAP